MKHIIILTFSTMFFVLGFGQLSGPEGIDNGIKLWLDANDSTTVYKDAGTTLATDGETVRQWNDKSGNDAHVSQNTANRRPEYVSSHSEFNDKSCLDFDTNDWLRHVSSKSNWTSAYTMFIVLYSDEPSPPLFSSFFSNDNNVNNGSFQIDYKTGISEFRWKTGSGSGVEGLFGSFESEELKLYTLQHTGDTMILKNDGMSVDTIVTTNGKNFDEYRINSNRSSNRHHDSKIAEIIIYDRSLTTCEIDTINRYLGKKYGRDFNNITEGYDYNVDFSQDVAAIGKYGNVCFSEVLDSATSSICTITNPSSNDANNEFILFGHDGAPIININRNNVPSGVGKRLERIWRFDEDGSLGTFSISFDVQVFVDINDAQPTLGSYYLIRSSSSDFSSGSIVSSSYTLDGNIVTFSGVSLSDSDFFTLGGDDHFALPVELLYFDVSLNGQNYVDISWETATEVENDFFTIERSIDGVEWEVLTTVRGAGNTVETKFYSAVDENPYHDYSYYRLKQTDYNGEYEYFDVKTIYLERKNEDVPLISLYPNPAKDIVTIEGTNIIRIYTALGQDVTLKTLTVEQSHHYVRLDVSMLINGIYFLRTSNQVIQFVKK